MKQLIDLENWNRKEHFYFFSKLDDPFWGITTTVDFTKIYLLSKELEKPFFLYSIHFLLKTDTVQFFLSYCNTGP